jgi:hypothetical protein
MLVSRRKRAASSPTQVPYPVPLAALRTPPDHTWGIGTTYAGRRAGTDDGGRDASLSQSPQPPTLMLVWAGSSVAGAWVAGEHRSQAPNLAKFMEGVRHGERRECAGESLRAAWVLALGAAPELNRSSQRDVVGDSKG